MEQSAYYYPGFVFDLTENLLHTLLPTPPPQKKNYHLHVRKYLLPQKIAQTTTHFNSFGLTGTNYGRR